MWGFCVPKACGKSKKVCQLGPHRRAATAMGGNGHTPYWVLPGLPRLPEPSRGHRGAPVGISHGIFLLEPDPVPCYYSVTLGEPVEFQKG